jgi:uncharacterized membrane protein YczE
MAHRDDSFWVSVFRKSPIIGVCMAVCGLIGAAIGSICFYELLPFLRAYLCALISCILGGLFVGLAIGVALDSLIGPIFRKGGKKKRERDRWRLD